jgi:hypothetical protein
MDLVPQRHAPDRLQAVEAVVEPRPVVPPVHALDPWLPIQAPGEAPVLPPGDLPTHACGQMLGDLVGGLSQGPPPSLTCPRAREERGPQIKAFPSVGISVTERHSGLI